MAVSKVKPTGKMSDMEKLKAELVMVKSMVPQIAAKEVKRKLVALLQSDGSWTGYEYDVVGYEQKRRKFSYPNYQTEKQDRVEIEKFPWETV